MGHYVSDDGEVLVVRYPVLRRTLASGPLPPVRIVKASGTATQNLAYIVYEPYEEQNSGDIPSGW